MLILQLQLKLPKPIRWDGKLLREHFAQRMSGTAWDFAYLVPHIAYDVSIENDYLALVPPSDQRLIDLAASNPAVGVLTTKLTDQFKNHVAPSALLIRRDAPASVNFYAVLSFRNAIAISSLVDGWSCKLSGGRVPYPLWTDFFDLYPFTATRKGDELSARSMALRSIDDNLEKFDGQIAPHLPNNCSLSCGYDDYLLKYLMAEWKSHFLRRRTQRRTRVLFRSLEVAAQAARMPAIGTREPTIHDVGVAIALWVSAFEVLTHPTRGNASLRTVIDCIEGAEWCSSDLKAQRYTLKSNSGKTTRKINFSQRLYTELYKSRNCFLHGNRVTEKSLFPFKNSKLPLLTSCAVLVYRSAIAGFSPKLHSSRRRTKSLASDLVGYFDYLSKVRQFENAMEKLMVLSRR